MSTLGAALPLIFRQKTLVNVISMGLFAALLIFKKQFAAIEIWGLGFLFVRLHSLLKSPTGRFDENFLYLIFVPAAVSGPILEPAEFKEKLKNAALPDSSNIIRAFSRISLGLFLKLVLADQLTSLSVEETLIGVYAWAFRIFLEFNGYTQIAIGLGALLGMDIPENFHSPYWKRTVADFWKSWHATFSSWIRKHVFSEIAMTGPLRGKPELALVAAFIASALWHGSDWNFIAWGAWYSFCVIFIDPILRKFSKSNPLPPIIVFHLVCVGWILFRGKGISRLGSNSTPELHGAWIILLAIGLLPAFFEIKVPQNKWAVFILFLLCSTATLFFGNFHGDIDLVYSAF